MSISRWREEYLDGLEDIAAGGEFHGNNLSNTVMEYGILAHVAPIFQDEFEERKRRRRPVWRRDDPDLYWRIMYGLECAREAIAHNWTVCHGVACWAIVAACRTVTEAGRDRGERLLAELRERAEFSIRALGGNPVVIPWGTKGTFKGVAVTVDRYTPDGLVCLQAETYEGHAALYDASDHGRPVEPREFVAHFVPSPAEPATEEAPPAA